MRANRVLHPFYSVVLLIAVAWFALSSPDSINKASLQTPPQPTPIMPTLPFADDSWITVDLPENATQLDYGWEIYRLVCSACHAYDGTGLTERWRATWGAEDQNCWQSKCHASNHPPEGFLLPVAPAITGAGIRSKYETAQDLSAFIFNEMPWHAPKTLAEEEVWAVTAFVLELNDIDPGPALNAENAQQIRLSLPVSGVFPGQTALSPSPEAAPPIDAPAPQPGSENAPSKPDGFMREAFLFMGIVIVLFVLLTFGIFLYVR